LFFFEPNEHAIKNNNFIFLKRTKMNIDLIEEIKLLKTKKNAIILAHYYQDPDIQDIADYIGDSLGLSQQAAKSTAKIIVFAGVHFMAETAKILNPTTKVLIPDMNAGCSLADTCPPESFKSFIEQHPNHTVISYINCSAEIKAMSDIICTSSNALKIVNSLPADEKIIFAPDKNLGKYIVKKSGREMVLWEGSCIVHELFSEKKITELKLENPDAILIAHPECEDPILKIADFIGSTTALLDYVKTYNRKKFIVATESGILHQMQKFAPEAILIPAPPENNCACNDCPYMKLNTLEKIYLCLRDEQPELLMKEDLRKRAEKSMKRMLELS
jgi:quinolinate synthase